MKTTHIKPKLFIISALLFVAILAIAFGLAILLGVLLGDNQATQIVSVVIGGLGGSIAVNVTRLYYENHK